MKQKRQGFVLLVSVLLLLALMLSGCARSAEIRFGTAAEGGAYYAYGTAAADIVKGEAGVSLEVKQTAGAAANIRLLSEGYLQMAITQSDVAADAWNGQGAFADDARTGYSAVASLYTEYCHIVVRADSEIRTVEDLDGKVVSIGEVESGAELNAEQILQCCGLSKTLLQVRNYNYEQAAKALKNGEIDAFFCTVGLPMQTVSELAKETPVRLLPLTEKQMQRLTESYGGYIRCTIPADTYSGQTEEVNTVGVRAVLLANDDLDEETVKKVLSVLMSKAEELKTASGTETALSLETSGEGIAIPYHPGAAVYYRENGITVEMEAAG